MTTAHEDNFSLDEEDEEISTAEESIDSDAKDGERPLDFSDNESVNSENGSSRGTNMSQGRIDESAISRQTANSTIATTATETSAASDETPSDNEIPNFLLKTNLATVENNRLKFSKPENIETKINPTAKMTITTVPVTITSTDPLTGKLVETVSTMTMQAPDLSSIPIPPPPAATQRKAAPIVKPSSAPDLNKIPVPVGSPFQQSKTHEKLVVPLLNIATSMHAPDLSSIPIPPPTSSKKDSLLKAEASSTSVSAPDHSTVPIPAPQVKSPNTGSELVSPNLSLAHLTGNVKRTVEADEDDEGDFDSNLDLDSDEDVEEKATAHQKDSGDEKSTQIPLLFSPKSPETFPTTLHYLAHHPSRQPGASALEFLGDRVAAEAETKAPQEIKKNYDALWEVSKEQTTDAPEGASQPRRKAALPVGNTNASSRSGLSLASPPSPPARNVATEQSPSSTALLSGQLQSLSVLGEDVGFSPKSPETFQTTLHYLAHHPSRQPGASALAFLGDRVAAEAETKAPQEIKKNYDALWEVTKEQTTQAIPPSVSSGASSFSLASPATPVPAATTLPGPSIRPKETSEVKSRLNTTSSQKSPEPNMASANNSDFTLASTSAALVTVPTFKQQEEVPQSQRKEAISASVSSGQSDFTLASAASPLGHPSITKTRDKAPMIAPSLTSANNSDFTLASTSAAVVTTLKPQEDVASSRQKATVPASVSSGHSSFTLASMDAPPAVELSRIVDSVPLLPNSVPFTNSLESRHRPSESPMAFGNSDFTLASTSAPVVTVATLNSNDGQRVTSPPANSDPLWDVDLRQQPNEDFTSSRRKATVPASVSSGHSSFTLASATSPLVKQVVDQKKPVPPQPHQATHFPTNPLTKDLSKVEGQDSHSIILNEQPNIGSRYRRSPSAPLAGSPTVKLRTPSVRQPTEMFATTQTNSSEVMKPVSYVRRPVENASTQTLIEQPYRSASASTTRQGTQPLKPVEVMVQANKNPRPQQQFGNITVLYSCDDEGNNEHPTEKPNPFFQLKSDSHDRYTILYSCDDEDTDPYGYYQRAPKANRPSGAMSIYENFSYNTTKDVSGKFDPYSQSYNGLRGNAPSPRKSKLAQSLSSHIHHNYEKEEDKPGPNGYWGPHQSTKPEKLLSPSKLNPKQIKIDSTFGMNLYSHFKHTYNQASPSTPPESPRIYNAPTYNYKPDLFTEAFRVLQVREGNQRDLVYSMCNTQRKRIEEAGLVERDVLVKRQREVLAEQQAKLNQDFRNGLKWLTRQRAGLNQKSSVEEFESSRMRLDPDVEPIPASQYKERQSGTNYSTVVSAYEAEANKIRTYLEPSSKSVDMFARYKTPTPPQSALISAFDLSGASPETRRVALLRLRDERLRRAPRQVTDYGSRILNDGDWNISGISAVR